VPPQPPILSEQIVCFVIDYDRTFNYYGYSPGILVCLLHQPFYDCSDTYCLRPVRLIPTLVIHFLDLWIWCLELRSWRVKRKSSSGKK